MVIVQGVVLPVDEKSFCFDSTINNLIQFYPQYRDAVMRVGARPFSMPVFLVEICFELARRNIVDAGTCLTVDQWLKRLRHNDIWINYQKGA